MGRHSEYKEQTADIICERIAEGKSLRAIVREDDSLPSVQTVCKWLGQQPKFAEQYARARELQADVLFDEILEISDDGKNDTYLDNDGNKRTDQEVIARSRLRVDARKWMAGKLRPKKYGEFRAVELTGENGGAVKFEVVAPWLQAEIAKRNS